VTRGRETAEATAGPLFDVECGIVRDLDVAYRHVCVLCVLCATVGVGSMWRSIHPRPAVQSSRVKCPGDTAALPVDDKSTNNHQRSKLLHKRPSSNITPTANTNGYDLGWCIELGRHQRGKNKSDLWRPPPVDIFCCCLFVRFKEAPPQKGLATKKTTTCSLTSDVFG
jgi:hypothetical protein